MNHARIAAAALAVAALVAACSRNAATAQDPNAPMAKTGDGKVLVTDAEMTAEAKAAIAAVDARYAEELHDAKARALEALVEQRLLEAKAKSEGLSVETLLARDVRARLPEPSEEMLRSVYDQTKASGKAVPPYEQSRAEIAAFVKSRTFESMRQAYVAKLRADAKVQTLLPPVLPPRLDFKAEGPSKGSPGAPVTIVEFSDYECSFCAGAEPVVKQVLAAYGEKVRFVFQQYPLSIHADAPKASEAALCAGEQGKYWEMHDRLFANQQALKPPDLKAHAAALGLDAARFGGCLDSGRMAGVVDASRRKGESLGINATPTFFVNGRMLTGGQSPDRFRELIDHELAAASR